MNKKQQIPLKSQKLKNEIKKENEIEKIFSTNWAIIFLFFVTTLIAYSNSFNVPFQFDDEQQIVYQESNHSFHNFTNLSYWMHVNNRPVSTFTLVANYILNRDNVFGYHVVNFIIHLLTGVFLFFFIQLIIPLSRNHAFSKWLPVVITLFFLIQPVQIQSVTYIVQRMTSLAGMFFVLSIFLYTKGRVSYFRKGNTISGVALYFFALLAGILGTLSKQNAIVFPLAMLLTELFFIRNNNGEICKRYIVSSLALGAVALVVFAIRFGLPHETNEINRVQYLATQMIVIPRYFQMMLIPLGLSIDHGVGVLKNILDLKVILGASFLIGMLLFAIFQRKKQPLVSFGIFWIFIALLIESSIFPIRDVMFEQRMYVPLIGFSMAMWTLIFDLVSKKKPKLLFPIVLIVLLAMSVGTYARNNVWRSRIDIWEKVTELYPDHFRGWQGLGRAYVATHEKNVSKIIRCYERALEIKPDDQSVLNDLAVNYLKVNKASRAIDCLKKLENSANMDYRMSALHTLGLYYLSNQKYDLSENYFEKAVELDPADTAALQGLSSLYVKEKDFEKAVTFSEKALEVSPNETITLINMGYSQIFLGRSDLSKKYFLKALEINPANANALVLYANACVNTGDFDGAITTLKKAFEILKDNQLLIDIEKVEKMKQKGH